MQKLARKPSSDPAQEKIRQSKASWNKEVTVFINDLISLKKTMNGWPSKFHKERSKINDPIPGDPNTILGVLASDFQELAQRGNQIIQYQIDYSKNRRKKQDKSPDLSKQLNLFSDSDFNLISEGSNPVSRFFARMLNTSIFGGPEAASKRFRMAALSANIDIYDNLNRLQEYIVMSTPESIFNSQKVFQNILNQWGFFKQGFLIQKDLNLPPDSKDKLEAPPKKPEAGESLDTSEGKPAQEPELTPEPPKPAGPIPEQVELLDSVKFAIEDFKRNILNFTDLDHKDLNALIIGYSQASNFKAKLDIAPKLLEEYKKILNQANLNNQTNASSLKEILKLKKKASVINKLAQGFLQKWINNLSHKAFSDKTSAFRLSIYDNCKIVKKQIDDLMDSLEKELNSEEIKKIITTVDHKFMLITVAMNALYKNLSGKELSKEFIDLLHKNQATEYGFDLNEDQTKRLEKMLLQRQLRDLAKDFATKTIVPR